MNGSQNVSPTSDNSQLIWCKEVSLGAANPHTSPAAKRPFAPLQPLRQWIDLISVHSPETARFICKVIPAQCPFERTVKLFGRTVLYIPPMCKLNPFYNEFVSLRFRALCYLADECGEDVTPYC